MAVLTARAERHPDAIRADGDVHLIESAGRSVGQGHADGARSACPAIVTAAAYTITIVNTGATNGGFVAAAKGDWAREA